MLHAAHITPERVRPLHRSEYERLVELGAFADERVELLCGTLVTMSPQGSLHAAVVARLNQLLVPTLLGRAVVRIQSPLAVSDDSEPEPDVAVVPLGDYFHAHPNRAHLVIEVADTSLRKDRDVKADLYARGSIPEYWVVDLAGGVVEVHTRIEAGAYTARALRSRDHMLMPVEFPDVALAVRDFLP